MSQQFGNIPNRPPPRPNTGNVQFPSHAVPLPPSSSASNSDSLFPSTPTFVPHKPLPVPGRPSAPPATSDPLFPTVPSQLPSVPTQLPSIPARPSSNASDFGSIHHNSQMPTMQQQNNSFPQNPLPQVPRRPVAPPENQFNNNNNPHQSQDFGNLPSLPQRPSAPPTEIKQQQSLPQIPPRQSSTSVLEKQNKGNLTNSGNEIHTPSPDRWKIEPKSTYS